VAKKALPGVAPELDENGKPVMTVRITGDFRKANLGKRILRIIATKFEEACF